MVFIVGIHMSGRGHYHEHIEEVKWQNPETKEVGQTTVSRMVDWIDREKGVAKVTDGKRTVDVGVVRPVSGAAYLRTYADGVWTDNLLSLPKY